MAAISNFLRCSEWDFKICSECMPIIKQGNIRRALRRMANRNIDTIDAGVAVLSMHAPVEVVSKLDCYETYKGMKAIYQA